MTKALEAFRNKTEPQALKKILDSDRQFASNKKGKRQLAKIDRVLTSYVLAKIIHGFNPTEAAKLGIEDVQRDWLKFNDP